MLSRTVVGSSIALVLFASLVACGSKSSAADAATSDDANQTETPADGDAGPTPTAAPGAAAQQPAPSDAPPPAATDGGVPGAGDGGGGGGGAGNGTGGGGGPGAPPNPQCQASSVRESGSNDTAATANAIPAATGSFCGTLDSATDVDFVTFTLPANAKSLGFGLAYSQLGVVVEGSAGGESFVVGSKPAFKPGQTYTLEVHTSGMAPVDYLLTVDIK